MNRTCKGCSLTKPITEFYRKLRYKQYPNSISGYSHKCILCTNLDRKEFRLKNPDKVKYTDENSRLKRTYGIDLIEYNQMSENQQHQCLGCKRHKSNFKYKLVVDHCHSTGKVRGLLCTTCNLILGYAFDNIDVLTNLIGYLNPELAVNTSMKKVG